MSELAESLQQRQLVAHWDKTGYVTSSAELDSELNERWSLGHEQKLRSGRCLGTGATDGASRSVQEQNKRLAKAPSVSKRVFFSLRQAGASVSTIMRGSPTATA
eukprot:1854442-Pyramimonas_sp.AAC.1